MTNILENWRKTLTDAQRAHLKDMQEYHARVRYNKATGVATLPEDASEGAKRYGESIGKVDFKSLK